MVQVAAVLQQGENTATTAAELWRFALAYYAEPGVAAALEALQDRRRIDVGLTLFALWHGQSGRGRLDRQALAAAERKVRAVRSEIIEPLRALRRRLKSHPDPDVQRLREAIKSLEIEGEKTALDRLAANLARPNPMVDRATALAAADANLALCLGPEAPECAEAAVLRDRLARLGAEPPTRRRPACPAQQKQLRPSA